MVRALDGGAALVVAWRTVSRGSVRWSLWRRALSRWGNRCAATALVFGARDSTSAFRAYGSATPAAIDRGDVRADG